MIEITSINKHLDKVSVGLFCHAESVFGFLGKGYKKVSDKRVVQKDKSGLPSIKSFQRLREYSHGISLFYNRKNKSFNNVHSRLFLHDPTSEILCFVHEELTNIHERCYSLTEVEYAYDFYSNQPELLCRLLWENISVPNSRFVPSRFDKCATAPTYYLNNPRKTQTKGIRIYTKQGSDGNSFTRLEIVLKRRRLKDLSLDLRLKGIDEKINWKKYLFFSGVDKNKLCNHLDYLDRSSIKKIEFKRPGYGNLVRLQNDSFVDSLFTYYSLGEQRRSLRELEITYNRFIYPVTTFDALFDIHPHDDSAFPISIPVKELWHTDLHEIHENNK